MALPMPNSGHFGLNDGGVRLRTKNIPAAFACLRYLAKCVSVWALVGMSIAAMGFYGSKGPFWSIPSMILTGTAAASGIAWINSVGNLGGFFGPTMVGWAKDYTGSFAGGLYALAACSLASAIISLFWIRVPRTVAAGAAAAAAAE